MEISTPGRICLFGEHLDYLGLPVIAMAISLRMSIKGTFRSDNIIKVDMPDINEMKVFCLDELNSKNKNYFKSGLKICKKAGLNFSRGNELPNKERYSNLCWNQQFFGNECRLD